MDRHFGPNFKKGMQGSMDRQIGPNFEIEIHGPPFWSKFCNSDPWTAKLGLSCLTVASRFFIFTRRNLAIILLYMHLLFIDLLFEEEHTRIARYQSLIDEMNYQAKVISDKHMLKRVNTVDALYALDEIKNMKAKINKLEALVGKYKKYKWDGTGEKSSSEYEMILGEKDSRIAEYLSVLDSNRFIKIVFSTAVDLLS